ncbi:CTD small phosphatase-like protein 2-A [Larimichthys crocea]|uniref:Uncharacterized protein n=1 Tax=Larimichthys crocea TaxID=215358 RepID=A0ACD3R033_LARCR|nr:CTD small phosphatase-like protein 2-A [Larimichthys crocea]
MRTTQAALLAADWLVFLRAQFRSTWRCRTGSLTVVDMSRHIVSQLLLPLHVTAKTMRLRMRKASQQSNPTLESRPSRTKRRHSEVEEDTPPTSGGRGLFSTIKKFIRGNAVKVQQESPAKKTRPPL